MPEDDQICETCRNRVVNIDGAWLHAPPSMLPAWSIAAAQLDGDHAVVPAGTDGET